MTSGSVVQVENDKTVSFLIDNLDLLSAFNVEGPLVISGENNVYRDLSLSEGGEITFQKALRIDNFHLGFGSRMNLEPGVRIEIKGNFLIQSDADRRVLINGSVNGNGKIVIDGHRKVCLDFLEIENVDLESSASVTVGANSRLVNASYWLTLPCADVLFSNFSFQYACRNALTQFTDLSTGDIESWYWSFGDGNSSQKSNPFHQFTETGTYSVTLDIRDASDQAETHTLSIDVTENTLAGNRIVNNNGVLTSFQLSETYQWYLNDQLIEAAEERSYDTGGQNGRYFVLTFDELCNIKSEEFGIVISSLSELEQPSIESGLKVFPNPTTGKMRVTFENDYFGIVVIQLFDLRGNVVFQDNLPKKNSVFEVDVSPQPMGIYLLRVYVSNDELVNSKVIIK